MVGASRTTRRGLQRKTTAVVVLALAAVVVFVVLANEDRFGVLSAALGVAAGLAGLTMTRIGAGSSVSASFIVVILAAALLGPASACAAAAIAELAACTRVRPSAQTALTNLAASMLPAVAAALLIRALAWPPADKPGFYLSAAAASVVAVALNYAIVAPLLRLFQGRHVWSLGAWLAVLPSQGINIALAVAGTSIYLKIGLRGIVFALAAVFAFSYMAHLLAQSRQRAEQYVSLSWGVLAGLLRSLDIRDGRAARHAAAVARFARDIAQSVGMDEREQELAHTAGLLHDIGHFALSDRVHERGRTLADEDWAAIQRHPELGADMLRDLGMYGPVAEIVRSHHERLDGRGYPRGLPDKEIPEIAKIISVAEVYDTLTASDTYRTRMSSFEALRELRRVAGSQLEPRYVEVLASLLSGEGIEYRHADAADFDTELDMERRINEARAG
jgi:putative nucleotidyltransferase with HDIG domain